MLKSLKYSIFFLLFCVIANVATLPVFTANASTHESRAIVIGDNDSEFVFAGKCPRGESYRFSSYQLEIDGLTQSFYDYEGPAGKGTVRTNAEPKKMLARLCHELADINNGSKFD